MAHHHSKGRGATGALLTARVAVLMERIEASLTPYDLFAIAVVYMVFAHFSENIFSMHWLRTGDRILVPIFLISIGYNVGRKVDWKLIGCAAVVSGMRWFMFERWMPQLPLGAFSVLVTIVATRLVIEPLMQFALRSRMHFWGVNIALLALSPWTGEHISAYGTLGIMMAMAGWLARCRHEIPKNIVNADEYFMLVFCCHVALNQLSFGFSALQLACIVLGGGFVFRLLYDMRRLLQTSLRRKPRDSISKICRFVGGNSLEIYTLHMIAYYALYYYAFSVPL